MIDGKRVVAVIVARGGSKGLPGKNVLPLAGRPLIAWTADAALRSRYADRVIVSTDDAAIAAAARAAGAEVPFMRPAELASDAAGSADVLAHALTTLGEVRDLAVLLQPTSPLRQASDIDACLEECVRHGARSCVAVCAAAKSPYWMFERCADGSLRRFAALPEGASRRQALPPSYVVNGAVYVVDAAWFLRERRFIDAETRSVVMPKERSVDIDDAVDFALAETLMRGGAAGSEDACAD